MLVTPMIFPVFSWVNWWISHVLMLQIQHEQLSARVAVPRRPAHRWERQRMSCRGCHGDWSIWKWYATSLIVIFRIFLLLYIYLYNYLSLLIIIYLYSLYLIFYIYTYVVINTCVLHLRSWWMGRGIYCSIGIWWISR